MNNTAQITPNTVFAPVIRARQHHQGERIENGIDNGSLTSSEATALRAMRADERQDFKAAKADGRLDVQERLALHQELNEISRAIYEFKHN